MIERSYRYRWCCSACGQSSPWRCFASAVRSQKNEHDKVCIPRWWTAELIELLDRARQAQSALPTPVVRLVPDDLSRLTVAQRRAVLEGAISVGV